MTEEIREDVVLAASEAAGNSIEHGYSEATEDDIVELIFWIEPGAVCIEIVDYGVWRTPSPERLGRGRGIPLMSHLMESVLIQHGPDGTSVLLRSAIPAGVLGRNE